MEKYKADKEALWRWGTEIWFGMNWAQKASLITCHLSEIKAGGTCGLREF